METGKFSTAKSQATAGRGGPHEIVHPAGGIRKAPFRARKILIEHLGEVFPASWQLFVKAGGALGELFEIHNVAPFLSRSGPSATLRAGKSGSPQASSRRT